MAIVAAVQPAAEKFVPATPFPDRSEAVAGGIGFGGGFAAEADTHFTSTHSTAIVQSLRCLRDGQDRLEAQLRRIERLCIRGEGSTAHSHPLSSTNDGASTRSEHDASPALTQGDPPQLPEVAEIQERNSVLQALQEPSSSLEDGLLHQEAEEKIAFMNRHHQQFLEEQGEARQALFNATNIAKGWKVDIPRRPIEHDAEADAHFREVGGVKAWLNEQIDNGHFDMAFGLVILANAMLMFLRGETRGQEVGYKCGFSHGGVLGHVKPQDPKHQIMVHFDDHSFHVVNLVFLVLFTAEIIVRIAIRYRTFFNHAWNYLDLLLVAIAYLEEIFSFANLTFLRVFRLVRLTRALRVARVMRSFEPLRILVSTAMTSLLSLFWAIILIGLILLLAACAMMEIVQGDIENDSVDFEVREELWRKFGTAGHAYYTFFRWTLTTSWTSDVELLINGVNEYIGFFVFPFIILVNFAIIRVVTALFIRDTFAAGHRDNMEVLEETMKHDNDIIINLKAIFRDFDEDRDGVVTKSEFEEALRDPRLQVCLRLLEVEPYLAQSLFVLLDHGMGKMSVDELVAGAMDLRQQAIGKGVDLPTVKYESQKSMLVVRNIEQQCSMILKYMEYTMKHMSAMHELHHTGKLASI